MAAKNDLSMRRVTPHGLLGLSLLSFLAATNVLTSRTFADRGTLTVTVHDEETGEPAVTRVEIFSPQKPNSSISVRKTVPAGMGLVLDRSLDLTLRDGGYHFRMVRGPEYRIISGRFTLEETSSDSHNVDLPRMINMHEKGWISGDCLVVASPHSLPLRMVSEDLHVAAVLGHVDTKPIPGRERTDVPAIDPMWIRDDTVAHRGLAFYGISESEVPPIDATASQWIAATANREGVKIGLEQPFAWPLPVWLASERIDGFFLLGDWLRLDQQITTVPDGRETQSLIQGTTHSVGQWAEQIYWNILEAGFRIPPLAGSGDGSRTSPVGYNRLYVADPLEESESNANLEARTVVDQSGWWNAAWSGRSVATNGPMLRPKLNGQIPGHVFRGSAGDALELRPEVMLAVRDPVDYLEVIHNGQVHYKAKLDEFAAAGGIIPSLVAKQSGWVVMRVVTLFDDHYRVAISAPWYIEFDGQRRVTPKAVEFFQQWQVEYEARLMKLPPAELARHVPFVKAARAFWKDRVNPGFADVDDSRNSGP